MLYFYFKTTNNENSNYKKAEMVQFLNTHKEILQGNDVKLISTGTTGKKQKKLALL